MGGPAIERRETWDTGIEGLVRRGFYRGRIDLHQTRGTWVGVGLGVLVITVGLSAIFGSISPAVGPEFEDLQGVLTAVLAINLPGFLAFAALFGAAVAFLVAEDGVALLTPTEA